MGTIQDPNPDRDWLKQTYTDTSSSPFSISSQTEMVGRLVEGTGDSRMARVGRVVFRVTAVLVLAGVSVGILAGLLGQAR